MIEVVPLAPGHIDAIVTTHGGNGWKQTRENWAPKLRAHNDGQCATRLAVLAGEVLGYGSLVWRSDHHAFAAAGIPEINDLVTAAAHRGRGVATRLIAEFEALAVAAGCRANGLGVGLYADYGPAQRLYASLGYRPDGAGVTYRGQAVVPGSQVALDDDLLLWLTKPLAPTGAI
jgi:GNAT superfamily N-acetyltransferase